MNGAASARNIVAPFLRWGYRLRVHGAHHCPPRGPLLVVAPHRGFLDATAIATCLPRPVEVLVDPGALNAVGGRLPGRIVVDEEDPGVGLRAAVARLRQGGAVGAWSGEGCGPAAGYVLGRTLATVLPVVVLGGSGRHPGDPPRWRARIDVVVGEPVAVAVSGDPLARVDVLRTAETVRQVVVDHAVRAMTRMGYRDGGGVDLPEPAPDNGML